MNGKSFVGSHDAAMALVGALTKQQYNASGAFEWVVFATD